MDWLNTTGSDQGNFKESFIERWFKNIDQVAVLMILILFFIGLTIQSIAASELSEVRWHKQMLIGLCGVVGMFAVSMMPRSVVMAALPVLFLLSVLLMIMTQLFGIEKNGATRWLPLPILNMQFQPMELYKVCSVSVLAIILGWMTEMDYPKWVRLAVMALFMGVTVFFGWEQPDMGQMLITCTAMLFITLLSIRLSFVYTVAALVSVLMVLGLVIVNAQHGFRRIYDFFFGKTSDKSQSGFAEYVMDRALLLGRAEGKSFWSRLPDVETDYVFVLIAGEFGLLIALLLVVMLVWLYLRFLWRVWNSDDIKIRLWSWGIVVVYTAQVFVNVGTATGSVPTKGITLPILSYGGSSLLTVFFALGLLLFMSRRDIKDSL